MQFRLMVILAFLLGLTTACGPIANSGNQVNFKSYNSIYQETTGEPAPNQGDLGLVGGVPGTGDGGLGGMGNSDSGDGGASGSTGTGGGGSTGIPIGGGTMTPGAVVGETDSGDGGSGVYTLPGGNMTRPVEENLFVSTNIEKICQAGEIDIIRAMLVCNPTSNLILTMKDGLGEVLLENFGNKETAGSAQAVIDKVKSMQVSNSMAGKVVDIFLCLDHDGDNLCTDEEVKDLNEHNKDILQSVMTFKGASVAEVAAAHDKGDDVEIGQSSGLCADDRLGALKNGLVFYHQEFKDDTADTQSSRVNATSMVAEEMAKYVKNIAEENASIDFSLGTPISITLVESDRDACSDIGVRMHGCFVKGTKIAMGKDFAPPIEDLRVGDSVLLSSGKTSKIVKIVSGPEKKPVIQLNLVNGKTLTVTETHPMLTEMGVVQAKNLSIGSRLLTDEGHWITLSSISTQKYSGHVFNIELAGSHESDHLIYGNGVVTGDLYLQQKLQTQPNPGLQFSLNK